MNEECSACQKMVTELFVKSEFVSKLDEQSKVRASLDAILAAGVAFECDLSKMTCLPLRRLMLMKKE